MKATYYNVPAQRPLSGVHAMKTKVFFILFAFVLFAYDGKCADTYPSDKNIIQMDMNKYQTISFDSLVTDISCTRLEKNMFDGCINMIQYKDYFYLMGYSIAGRNLVIYNTAGKFIKEITFSDALIVNSMCIVPELEELWVVSRFKIINKFKLDGTPLTKVSLPFPCTHIIPTKDREFLVYSGGANHERGSIEGHFMALTDFKAIHNLFIPMWGEQKRPYASYNIYTTDRNKNIFIFPARIDTIYSYNYQKKELFPLYALDFHGDFLTLDKYSENDQKMHQIITQRQYIYSHYSFYEASDKLFFKLKGKQENFCMIDRKTNALYRFDRLFDNFQSIHINPFIGSEGGKLYVLARESELMEHYANIRCSYPAIKKITSSFSADRNDWILLTINIK